MIRIILCVTTSCQQLCSFKYGNFKRSAFTMTCVCMSTKKTHKKTTTHAWPLSQFCSAKKKSKYVQIDGQIFDKLDIIKVQYHNNLISQKLPVAIVECLGRSLHIRKSGFGVASINRLVLRQAHSTRSENLGSFGCDF